MIRNAQANDMPVLMTLAEMMHAESRFSPYDFNQHQVEELFKNLIASPDGALFICEIDFEVVGFFAGQTGKTYLSMATVAFEHLVYVRKDKRGTFSSIRLIQSFIRWAREQGSAYIQVGVNSGIDDQQVTKLYKRLGFTLVGQALEMTVR